jgi:hypothetical protein
LEDPGVGGRIILRWIFRKWDVEVWTGSSWLRVGTGGERLIQGKRPLGRPGRMWEDNIKMDLQKVGCGSLNWVDLAEDRDRWREAYTGKETTWKTQA